MKMTLRFADLGPSGLVRRFAAVDDPAPQPERLEAARLTVADVTKPVTKPRHVTKPAGGRPALGAAPMTAAERAMRHIAQNLGLDWSRQYRKLLEQKDKFSCCPMATHDSG